jgi:hypothetical protein
MELHHSWTLLLARHEGAQVRSISTTKMELGSPINDCRRRGPLMQAVCRQVSSLARPM